MWKPLPSTCEDLINRFVSGDDQIDCGAPGVDMDLFMELPSPSRCKCRPVGADAAARSGALSAKSAVVRSVRPSRVSYREGNLMSGDLLTVSEGDSSEIRR
jgi:hypothetical protein